MNRSDILGPGDCRFIKDQNKKEHDKLDTIALKLEDLNDILEKLVDKLDKLKEDK